MCVCVSFLSQRCNVRMLTNAMLQKQEQDEGLDGMMLNKNIFHYPFELLGAAGL